VDSKLLRSRSGKVIAVLAIAFSATGVVALSTEPLPLLLTKIWIYIWFSYCAWLVFWNPSVRVSDSEVVVDNIFRTIRLNWSAIRRIDTKYSLTLETERGVFRAWAAPAPSRYAGFMANKSEAEHLPESSFVGQGLVRPGDLTSSDSGVAAYIIRQNWERLRDANQLDKKTSIESNLVISRIIIFVVLSVAAVFGFTF
jgi:hypothetical protein